jgi:hypothetical protein
MEFVQGYESVCGIGIRAEGKSDGVPAEECRNAVRCHNIWARNTLNEKKGLGGSELLWRSTAVTLRRALESVNRAAEIHVVKISS